MDVRRPPILDDTAPRTLRPGSNHLHRHDDDSTPFRTAVRYINYCNINKMYNIRFSISNDYVI